MYNRARDLNRLQENPQCDVLIIGAGINGIGTFRDLALQGVKVVLIDRADYCSGASAASSHMVHGGVRYLENGEFRLVREAVQERGRLLNNAPHLVKPLPTTIPIFKWFSGLLNAPFQFLGLRYRPSERGVVVIKIGLMLYEWFAGRTKNVPRHVVRNREESLAKFPQLNSDIRFTATYYDGAMRSPERLAIEVLFDGKATSSNALAFNYVSLVGSDGIGVQLKDEISGEVMTIVPKLVVNAAGPWVDQVNQAIGMEQQFIGGTKGSHLVLDHPELRAAIGEDELFFENSDGRIVLVFPFEDRALLGSSDIRIDNPDEAVITEEEIDYFIEMLDRIFPQIKVNRSHIVFTFSGVRPLPYQEVDRTGQISRDHKIEVTEASSGRAYPLLSLIGGKWTTFRAFAEVVSDVVLERLGVDRVVNTEALPIGGGRNYPNSIETQLNTWQTKFDCPPDVVALLFERYGTEAEAILSQMAKQNNWDRLKAYPNYFKEEIKQIVMKEDVIRLDDLVFRRTMLAMQGQITEKGLTEIAQLVAEVLDWDGPRLNTEIKRVQQILREKHRMDFNRYLPMRDPTQEEVI